MRLAKENIQLAKNNVRSVKSGMLPILSLRAGNTLARPLSSTMEQYITPLNIRVAGYVKEIRFTEHQYVHAGDTLLVLDDCEYRIRVKDAEAEYMDAKGNKEVLLASIKSAQTNIAIRDAEIEETRIRLKQQSKEYQRYENLIRDESVSRQQYEQIKADYDATKARYDALLYQKEAA